VPPWGTNSLDTVSRRQDVYGCASPGMILAVRLQTTSAYIRPNRSQVSGSVLSLGNGSSGITGWLEI
jgi:hypothetical protein